MVNGFRVTVTLNPNFIVPPQVSDSGHDRGYFLHDMFVYICCLWKAVLHKFQVLDNGFDAVIFFVDGKQNDENQKNFLLHLRREFGTAVIAPEKEPPELSFHLHDASNDMEQVMRHGFRCKASGVSGDWGDMTILPMYWRHQTVLQCYVTPREPTVSSIDFQIQLLSPGEQQCPVPLKMSAKVKKPVSGSFKEVPFDGQTLMLQPSTSTDGPQITVSCTPKLDPKKTLPWEFSFGVLFSQRSLVKPAQTKFRIKVKRTYPGWFARTSLLESSPLELNLSDIDTEVTPCVNLLVCGLASGCGRKSVIRAIQEILKAEKYSSSRNENASGPRLHKYELKNIANSKRPQLTFSILDTDGYHIDDVYDTPLLHACFRGLPEGMLLSKTENYEKQTDSSNAVSHVLLVAHALHLTQWKNSTASVNAALLEPLYKKFLQLLTKTCNGNQNTAQTRMYIVITHMDQSPLSQAQFMDSLRVLGIPENLIFPLYSSGNCNDLGDPSVTFRSDPFLQYLDEIRAKFPSLLISQIESCRKSTLLQNHNSMEYSAESLQHLEDMLRYML